MRPVRDDVMLDEPPDKFVVTMTRFVFPSFLSSAPTDHGRQRPASGILIHGPTGTGKTTLALALARATGLNAVIINAAAVRSKFVGESEVALAELMNKASQARPALLVIDHIDILAPNQVRFDPRLIHD